MQVLSAPYLISDLADKEKSYYAIINKTALAATQEIINEKKLEIGEEKVADLLKNLLRIYNEQYDTSVNDKRIWNAFPYDHPIIIEFRQNVTSIINENQLSTNYQNFAIDFNKKFLSIIDTSSQFRDYQAKQNFKNVSDSRARYFKFIIEELDKPSPIDGMKKTDYFIENKVVDLEVTPENWTISDDDRKIIELNSQANYFDLDGFLNSDIPATYIAAPFGTGKTTFIIKLATEIAKKYMLGELTWIPIYIPLIKGLTAVYKESIDFYNLLRKIIKPNEEKLLVICDGPDEYSGEVTKLVDEMFNVDLKLKEFSLSASDKVIFTTRQEAGIPQLLQFSRFTRLLPFDSNQISEFFKKYGSYNITYDVIKRYGLGMQYEGDYEIDFIKPLFCWMFAIAYKDIDETGKPTEISRSEIGEVDNTNISKAILYSTFIHSILYDRFNGEDTTIAYEKWILRKIAVLKTIFGDNLFIEDLSKHLRIFLEDITDTKLKEYIDEYSLNVILSSYSSQLKKRTLDFIHKSFLEYLVAESYLECILLKKWFRTNIGMPSKVTIDFLSSLLKFISSNAKLNQLHVVKEMGKSFYLNEVDGKIFTDEGSIITSEIVNKSLEAFEHDNIVMLDTEYNKSVNREFWKLKNIIE